MPNKNLTDSEIVKAWGVVKENKRIPTEYLINETLDLINRLQAENERVYADIMTYKLRWARATAKLNTAKSEAYKEFAERLKEYATQGFWEENAYVGTDQIDNLLKELVGDNNA